MGMSVAYFFIGVLAGTLSGLLGIGGGIVVVPGLALLFSLQDMPSALIMHMAAGTSLAIMIFTASRSLLAHLKRHIPFWNIYRQLFPTIIVGVVGGVVFAHFLHSNLIEIIFAIFLLLVAIRMFFMRRYEGEHRLPGQFGMSAMGVAIGVKSGLLGVGGGALAVPFLTHCHVPMRQVVVISSAVSLTVALVGAVSFAITGLHAQGLPAWSLGYINCKAWLPVALGSMLFAPLGVKLSHYLSTHILRRIFAVFLVVVSFHMLIGF